MAIPPKEQMTGNNTTEAQFKDGMNNIVDYLGDVDKQGLVLSKTEQLKLFRPIVGKRAKTLDGGKVWEWDGAKWFDTGDGELERANANLDSFKKEVSVRSDVLEKSAKDINNLFSGRKFYTYENKAANNTYIVGDDYKILLPNFNDDSSDLSFNNSIFHSYENKGSSDLIVTSNYKILLPASTESSNSAMSFNKHSFHSFKTKNLRDVQIDSSNSIISSVGLSKDYAKTDETQNYTYGNTVKHRFEVSEVYNLDVTGDYWKGDVMKLYAEYDKLLNAYPDYVSRSELGHDATGLPIYCYSFNPREFKRSGHSAETLAHPKIIIIGGVHGNERPAQLNNLLLFTHLCNHYLKDEVFTYLRHGVVFHTIPASNPWGVASDTRWNSNLVDLNRNYDSDWKEGTREMHDGTIINHGTAPLSEPESVIVSEFIKQHLDAALIIDTHSAGGDDYYMWIATISNHLIPVFKKASYEITANIYQKLRPKTPPKYNILFASHGAGTLTRYVAETLNGRSGLIETNNNNSIYEQRSDIKKELYLDALKTLTYRSAEALLNEKIAEEYK